MVCLILSRFQRIWWKGGNDCLRRPERPTFNVGCFIRAFCEADGSTGSPTLRHARLNWVKQNLLRVGTLTTANAAVVAAQNAIPLVRKWGGGDVASADGMRFFVPVGTIHTGPNPRYFGLERGVTWNNLASDQFIGLNAVTVHGTPRDSFNLLAIVLEQEPELQPTEIMTDTAGYTDTIFGMF